MGNYENSKIYNTLIDEATWFYASHLYCFIYFLFFIIR